MHLAFGVATLALVSQAARLVRTRTGNQATIQGCECQAPCSATSLDQFTCDTCKTQVGCGQPASAGTGNWDYCVFPEGSFDEKPAASKEDYYRARLLADKTRAPAYPHPALIFKQSMQAVFDNYLPEMPQGRSKLIHSIASVCEFELNVASGSPFTGLFASGLQRGFIRLGSAADPAMAGGFLPGVGIKMMRSGVHSGDTVLLHNLAPAFSYNFFERIVSNHIAAQVSPVNAKLQQGSQCANQVGLSDMARYSRDGSEHDRPRFPFKMIFVPSLEVQLSPGNKSVDQFQAEVAKFTVGTTLYTAYGCQSPAADEAEPTVGAVDDICGNPFRLGDVKTTSQCLPSKYGDEAFHFRHQRIEDDWALRPDWLKFGSYDAQRACGRSDVVSADNAPKSCNLKGMLDNDAQVD